MSNNRLLKAININLVIIVTVLCAFLLRVLSPIIMPFVLAVFVAVLLEPLLNYMRRRSIPLPLGIVLVVVIHLVFVYLFSSLATDTVEQILAQKEELAIHAEKKLTWLSEVVHEVTRGKVVLKNLFDKQLSFFSPKSLLKISAFVLNEVGKVTAVLGMAAIFLVFIVYSVVNYESKLLSISGDKVKGMRLIQEFKNIKSSVIRYFVFKALISLVIAMIFFLMCTFFGVDFAVFWGVLSFFFYFLPNVGAFLVSLFVGILAFLQIPSLVTFFAFMSVLIFLQFLVTNIMEPKFIGDRMNLNPTTVLVGLIFWGYLWGIVGMILSVPLMVLIKSILSRFPEYAVIVKLMGKS